MRNTENRKDMEGMGDAEVIVEMEEMEKMEVSVDMKDLENMEKHWWKVIEKKNMKEIRMRSILRTYKSIRTCNVCIT